MDPKHGWKINRSIYLFRSCWYALRQDELTLPNGRDITYTLVEHPGFVVVVPLLADGHVVMERIYRHPLQRTCLECPAGGLEGAVPEIAAARELEEETGYRPGRLEHLGRFAANSGISNVEYDLFLATGLTPDGVIRREDTEEIELALIPLATLREMVLNGQLGHGPSALGILVTCSKS